MKVDQLWAHSGGERLFICDFSPPRGPDAAALEAARDLPAHLVSVAYNPGKAVRLHSLLAAHWVRHHTGKEVVFTLATRDANKLALQSLLLGADLLGLSNVVVLQGDPFTERDRRSVSPVNDIRPTDLLRSIADLNRGRDFRGRAFSPPTDLCPGATLDLGRGLEREVGLVRRKIEAGARFLLSQPLFEVHQVARFLEAYQRRYGQEPEAPVFYGVQIMARDSLAFGAVPTWVRRDLERGRSGVDIALEVLEGLAGLGLRGFYVVPPIFRGGRRDYEAAARFLLAARG